MYDCHGSGLGTIGKIVKCSSNAKVELLGNANTVLAIHSYYSYRTNTMIKVISRNLVLLILLLFDGCNSIMAAKATPKPYGPHIYSCITEVCIDHVEVESHGHSGLSNACGVAFGCWRAEDAILRYGQVLHPGHLCHSASAGSGHLGLADLQMLHPDTRNIHPARYKSVRIRLQ